jgi:hypothetical protein
MLKKLGLILALLIVIAGAVYLLVLRKGTIPLTLNPSPTPTPGISLARGAVEKKNNGYSILGRFTTELKLDEYGNLEGKYILEGDPSQTEVRVLLMPLEGLIGLVRYDGSFSGSVSVERVTPDYIRENITKGMQVELSVSLPTDRPLKGYETFMKESLDVLASGEWEVPTEGPFVIISSYVGMIK